ncbi:MAG TPA: type 1 glutamine amidotransferase domain-containing protein [Candidatus Dormibacteraeota bacterium]|nr:type 1 glutamine amidotransferase domain-containing protein [Candidatus Dormibacteraeota bacterium]
MGLEGKRVAILVEDQYQMHEFWYPFYRFQEAGAEVKVVGTGRKDTFSSHDYNVTADLAAADAKIDDFDAVIIPGGYAPDMMRRSPEMVAFVHDMDAAGKPVAAICHAGWMLVSAKVVKGRRATCFYSIRDDLEAAGAHWSDEPVVVDGNLITSRVPADLPVFCKAVIKALSPVPAAVG